MSAVLRFMARNMTIVAVVVWSSALAAVLDVQPVLGQTTDVQADHVIDLWPANVPGPALEVGPEQDFTKPEDTLIAGRRIIKWGNVSKPQAHVFLPSADQRSGSAIVVCPGGGYSILAWDLEGTEVAQWLNQLGITAVVLKYRVPTRQHDPRWLAPVQDVQRTVSLVRHHAEQWGVDKQHVGVLGFSAGGDAAARAALAECRHYEAADAVDADACRPDLAVLVYPGYLANEARTGLCDDILVTDQAPPMFLVHAFDDPVPVESSLFLFKALKDAGVPSELHVFDAGGHGYGLRPVAELPVTSWPASCGQWLRRIGWAR